MQIIRGKQKTALKVVVYGPEGIGKSTFAAQFPNPLFIDTEGGTKHMDVARTPKPTSWVMLLGLVKECIADPSLCGTLIIDTMDWAELLCSRYVCDKAQKKSIEEFGYGKGYTYLMEEFGALLNMYYTNIINLYVKWSERDKKMKEKIQKQNLRVVQKARRIKK